MPVRQVALDEIWIVEIHSEHTLGFDHDLFCLSVDLENQEFVLTPNFHLLERLGRADADVHESIGAKADSVHDFAFAADPDYKHVQLQIENGPLVHLLYDPKTANEANWVKIQDGYLQGYFDFMAQHFGKYPYKQFSLIQGGDGGMEYPMCTMMLGGGDDFEGFTGLFVHEGTHNWYYGVIGTNEAAYPWMDEGLLV